jgi:hypothetical protein
MAVGWPEWLDPRASRVKDGRDPLALETITTDRIVPILVPGILALSTRARYLSFHLFLLDEYARRKLPPDPVTLGNFIRRREFEFAAAVLLCERCKSRPVGVRETEPKLRAAGSVLGRGESVDSSAGGYGLYYRSPLTDLGLVAIQGSQMGDRITPIDLIASERGRQMASTFREQIGSTEYFRNYFIGNDAIPLVVLRDYSEKCCLCRLDESQNERQLLYSALLEPQDGLDDRQVEARGRAFGMFLRLVDMHPLVARSQSEFRRATWTALANLKEWEGSWGRAVGQWAALHGKEYLQEALRLIWAQVNNLGRQAMPRGGFPLQTYMDLVGERLILEGGCDFGLGSIIYSRAMRTSEFADQVLAIGKGTDLEDILTWAHKCKSPAIGGISLLILLHDRARVAKNAPVGSGWRQIAGINGAYQPGLLSFLQRFEQQFDRRVDDLLQWIVRSRILRPHDQIATAKLPDFTFRFRLEGSRLRFYGNAGLFFPLADSRHGALSELSADLGLWESLGEVPRVTTLGHDLIKTVFA